MAAAWTVACTLWLGGAALSAASHPPALAALEAGPAPATAIAFPGPGIASPSTFALSASPASPSGTAVPARPIRGLQGLGGLPVRRLPPPFPWHPLRPDSRDSGEPDPSADPEGEEGAGGDEEDDADDPGEAGDGDEAGDGADAGEAGGSGEGNGEDDDVLQIEPPLEAFTVSIVSPEPGTPVSGRISVTAEVRADRPAAVRGVDFIVDGRVLFSDVEPPYELLWDSGEPTSHRIEVQAWGPGRQMVRDVLEIGAPGPAGGPGAAFSARVERVEIHVRVEGPEPHSIPARPESFRVLEEGRPQPVVAVERVSNLPVAVGMVVDHSGSMVERLERAMEAGGEFIDGLVTHPNDKAFLMAFSDVPVVLQGFTNDIERLRDSFTLIKRGRYTAFYDAVSAASRRFAGIQGRRALVVLTDGADQGSELDMREAIAAAQRADVAVYPVAVEVGPRFFREQWVMRRIASETGGRFFGLARREDPAEIYEAIAEDLRSQYRITYAPERPGGSGEWRTVVVELAEDVDDEVEIRARPGYYAR